MSKSVFILATSILILLLSACSFRPEFELYKGDSLHIAVIGEQPEIKEKQVYFNEITFNDLSNGDKLEKYDAVFIMKDNLVEASQDQYADIYLDAKIPFFYIQSTMSFPPFIEKGLPYKEVQDFDLGQSYATGFLPSSENGEQNYWSYGLYNNEINKANIKEIYSRIFGTIEQVRDNKY